MEAVNIISIITNGINDLKEQINDDAVVSYIAKEDRPEITSNVDDLMDRMRIMQNDLIQLTAEVAIANSSNTVDFKVNNKKLTIAEALICSKLWRSDLALLKSLASKSDKPVFRSSYRGDGNYELATFDVAKYKKIFESATKRVNTLSLAIDKANLETTIEFANVENYLG
jgi:hypothetical protein